MKLYKLFLLVLVSALLLAACTGQTVTEPDVNETAGETTTVTQPVPVDDETCAAVETAVASAFGVEATTQTEPFSDYVSGLSGEGCQVVAEGTGIEFGNFLDAADQLRAALESMGWTEDEAYLADGPTGTGFGYRLGDRLALVNVGWEPGPAVQCPADQPISACEVPPDQQIYTVTVNLAQLPADASGS